MTTQSSGPLEPLDMPCGVKAGDGQGKSRYVGLTISAAAPSPTSLMAGLTFHDAIALRDWLDRWVAAAGGVGLGATLDEILAYEDDGEGNPWVVDKARRARGGR